MKENDGTNGNEVGQMDERERSGMIGNERKTIDLLLFAGIEPTGTMFQTINNLLLPGIFTTSV